MNPKNSKKSPIHENADANITCDFGDGDISRSRSFLSNTYRRERPRPHARTRQSRGLLKFISRCSTSSYSELPISHDFIYKLEPIHWHCHWHNQQVHVCGLILERSLAEAFHSLSLNVIFHNYVNCVYPLIFQAYHLCVTTCSPELPKGRRYNISVFLTNCVCVYCDVFIRLC